MEVEHFSEETLKAREVFSQLDDETKAFMLALLRALNSMEGNTERTDVCEHRG